MLCVLLNICIGEYVHSYNWFLKSFEKGLKKTKENPSSFAWGHGWVEVCHICLPTQSKVHTGLVQANI